MRRYRKYLWSPVRGLLGSALGCVIAFCGVMFVFAMPAPDPAGGFLAWLYWVCVTFVGPALLCTFVAYVSRSIWTLPFALWIASGVLEVSDECFDFMDTPWCAMDGTYSTRGIAIYAGATVLTIAGYLAACWKHIESSPDNQAENLPTARPAG